VVYLKGVIMLAVDEIELKLRNKQHNLEMLAGKLSASLKVDNQGSIGGKAPMHNGAQLGLAQREAYAQQELQQVKHAILRIKQGVYSECELCHETIEANRLLALPYTALCSRCASEQ